MYLPHAAYFHLGMCQGMLQTASPGINKENVALKHIKAKIFGDVKLFVQLNLQRTIDELSPDYRSIICG